MVFFFDPGAGRNVAQGEANAPLVGGVGIGAVDDVGVVDGDVACFQFEVDSIRIVYLVGVNADTEHVFVSVQVDEISALQQAFVVGAGQDAHAAVFHSRVGSGHPEGGDFHGFKGPI